MADLARAQVRAMERGPGLGQRVEYLAFALADDTYAVPISEVREILKLPPVTEVPRSGPEILGIVSVRGLLVTVVDLRRRLRLPEAPRGRKGRILLVRGAQAEVMGLYVDEVLQVYRLADGEIEVASSVLGGGQLAEYVVGIGRPEGALLILLDLRPIVGQPPGGEPNAA